MKEIDKRMAKKNQSINIKLIKKINSTTKIEKNENVD